MFISDFVKCKLDIAEKAKIMATSGQCDENDLSLIRNQQKALNELFRFIAVGDWARKATRDKIAYFIKHNGNYRLTASVFSTSEGSLRVFVSRQNDKLEGLLSKSLFLISSGHIDEGLDKFRLSTGRYILGKELNYSISELLEVGDTEFVSSYRASDCNKEIEFVADILRSSVEKRLHTLDKSKLAYILNLIRSGSTNCDKDTNEFIEAIYKSRQNR